MLRSLKMRLTLKSELHLVPPYGERTEDFQVWKFMLYLSINFKFFYSQGHRLYLLFFRPTYSSTHAVWWPALSMAVMTHFLETCMAEMVSVTGFCQDINSQYSFLFLPYPLPNLPTEYLVWGAVISTSTAGSSSPSCSSASTWCTGWSISAYPGRFLRILST